MRFSTTLSLIVCVSTLLLACGSSTLSRSKAQELLAASAAFKQSKTYPFMLAKGISVEKAYEALASEGLIEVLHKPFGVVDTELTTKGRETAANLKWKIGPYIGAPRVLFVPVAVPELVAITGIMPSEKEAKAEFTWKWTLTAIGQKLAQRGVSLGGWGDISVGFNPGQVLNGEAVLQLYDDGWRVTDVSPEELHI